MSESKEVLGSGRMQEHPSRDGGADSLTNWRPIETARSAIKWCSEENPARVEALLFSPQIKRAVIGTVFVWPDEVSAQGEGYHGEWGFTHWMPLPSPPSEERLSSISAREAQAEPERPALNTSTVLSEADVGELVARMKLAWEHLDRESQSPGIARTLREAADLLTTLSSDKAYLSAQVASRDLTIANARRHKAELLARAERAEAERDAHWGRLQETMIRFSAAEADLSALKQRVAELEAEKADLVEKRRTLKAEITAKDRKLRRSASLRSSEGQPTDEGRRASSESHAQSIKGEDHGK